jgi:sulfotransferase
MRKFNVISGMPRAGTTLLCNLLNMNENFHVTPTSAVLDTVKAMRSNFSHDQTWKAQNRLEIADDFRNGIKGFVQGFFEKHDVVFDKSRGWPNNLKLIDDILQNTDTKVIWCYRDPVEIIGSIEAQYQKTSIIESIDEQGAPGAFATLDRRIGTFINDGGLVTFPIEALIDAIEMGYGDRILIIKYYDLTNNTQFVLDDIHDFIGEPRVTYDFSKLKQSTIEFDGMYNYKFLHTIKEGGVSYKKSDVELPSKYVDIINNKFAAFNRFIFEGNPNILIGATEEQLKDPNRRITLKLK